jgi:N-acetylglutamate synthase-like GNAT family acetyltransferase
MPGQCSIRRAADGDVAECERILRGLPAWFGIEDAIVNYVGAIRVMETYVAAFGGVVVGFVALAATSPSAVELHVMAVADGYHRLGLGRALVEHCESVLRARRVEYMHVKTLGPSRTCELYERTRAFYRAMGFHPLEENALWGETNPCLMLVKHLGCAGRAAV